MMLRFLWPLSLGAFALGLDAYVLAGLLPSMAQDLHTTQAGVGLGVAVFTAAYAISAPVLVTVASKYSMRAALLIGLTLFSIGKIFTMLSPSLSILLIARLVAGVGAGLYSPLASSCAANMVDVAQKGRALALILAGLSIGTALGVPIGLLIASGFGWRWTIGLIAILGIIAALGVAFQSNKLPSTPKISWRDRLIPLRAPFTVLTLPFCKN
ncbi:MAG: MFS transporter [Enterobacteriaceae bacterium]